MSWRTRCPARWPAAVRRRAAPEHELLLPVLLTDLLLVLALERPVVALVGTSCARPGSVPVGSVRGCSHSPAQHRVKKLLRQDSCLLELAAVNNLGTACCRNEDVDPASKSSLRSSRSRISVRQSNTVSMPWTSLCQWITSTQAYGARSYGPQGPSGVSAPGRFERPTPFTQEKVLIPYFYGAVLWGPARPGPQFLRRAPTAWTCAAPPLPMERSGTSQHQAGGVVGHPGWWAQQREAENPPARAIPPPPGPATSVELRQELGGNVASGRGAAVTGNRPGTSAIALDPGPLRTYVGQDLLTQSHSGWQPGQHRPGGHGDGGDVL